MDPAVYVLIFAMAALLIVALILSNSAAGGAVMPRFGPYWDHGGQANGSGMLY
jgi:hypothetical protein